jgi:hypothetical protein
MLRTLSGVGKPAWFDREQTDLKTSNPNVSSAVWACGSRGSSFELLLITVL